MAHIEALEISKGWDGRYPAALALARAGETRRANALTDDLERRFPEDTAVRFNYLPVLRAQQGSANAGSGVGLACFRSDQKRSSAASAASTQERTPWL